jgi:DNA-binding MarR family transcriptional regulator
MEAGMETKTAAKDLEFALALLARSMEAIYRQRRYPLERSHHLLRTLSEGPRRSRDLADVLLLDHSTIARQVSALEKLGLARRKPDPDDGRSDLVATTAKGEALCAATSAMRVKRIETLLESWSGEQRRALVESLKHLNGDLSQSLRELRASDGVA